MPSLLLVEDEEAIMRKLMHNVQWHEHGFEQVFSANNGLEALAVLEQHPVEIMVTDIQMPKMNGIELIKEVKKRDYQMKIIVISGFAEFEYAQESIKLNVSDYLLKPFPSRKLLEIVQRVREEMTRERAEKSELEGLREQLRKNLAPLREKFFIDLLNNNFTGTNIPAELEFLGLGELAGRNYLVVVMEIPESNLKTVNEEEKYLINLQFLRQAQRILDAGAYRHFLVNQRRNQITVIFFNSDEELPIRLEECLSQLRLALNQSLTFGVGHQYSSIQDLSISYHEACLALQYRYLHGLNQVFSISDVNLDNPSYHKQFYYLHQNRIFDNLKVGAHSAICKELAILITKMKESNMSPESLRIVASNLVLLTFTTLNELGYNPVEIFGPDFSPLAVVNQTESLDELEKFLLGLFEQINKYINIKRTSVNQQLIDKIRQHIEDNYAEDMTLSAMAIRYKISPGYLSLLFTERTGKNFIDHLTERRINKAKELLKHTDMKIYEISKTVGYNDSYYFSSCFKRIAGVSPSEYRENLENE
jgi:two-component system, response regulator YesN